MKIAWVIAVIAGFAVPSAHAEVPWAHGVAKETQNKANALFAEGNQLFAQQAHGPALEKYKQAIALWDHPMIRFNMAVTEIRLDRLLEAAEDLEQALRFDQTPFTKELYQQAMDYQRLVAGRVGTLEASCDQGSVGVLLDGKPWFSCPGSKKLRVLAGEHVIVGERTGFMTASRRVVVAGGKTTTEKLELLPIESAVSWEYPTPRWVPWTILAGGAVIAGGGMAIYFAGKNQMDRFESDFANRCPNGCSLSDVPDLEDDRDGAKLKGTIGISMLVVGGAVAVGGAVWAIVNRPTRVMPKVEVSPAEGGARASATWAF